MIRIVRKNYLLLTLFLLSGLLFSCQKDFLGKPMSSDVTIDTIFNSRIKAETFLWNVYSTSVPMGFTYNWGTDNAPLYASMLMACCDEGEALLGWAGSNAINDGNWGPTNTQEDNFVWHYKGIRNANIFIANIDRVSDITDDVKKSMKAEASVLKALMYYDMFKRYGGVPIVDKVLLSSDKVMLPRNTVEEVVNYIVKNCDEALPFLPDVYESKSRGRITKGAALALKSRTLLFAASPLFNTATPYLPTIEPKLVCYGNADPNRWKLAADAAKAVLDWAAANDCSLVTDADPGKAYETACAQNDNSEIILANKSQGQFWGWWSSMFGQLLLPSGIYDGWGGEYVTLNFARFYSKADGTPQTWPETGTYAEYIKKANEMEPRFQQSVWASGTKWNNEIGVRDYASMSGVGWMRKFFTRSQGGGTFINWPVFRLAEFYLNYAEALNEFSPMDQAAYDALNIIRNRSGVPAILNTDFRYNTQETFRQAIRRERAVELAFEEHRIFDVRRWLVADDEGVMGGNFYGYRFAQTGGQNTSYTKFIFEKRLWAKKMYLYPFPQSEIDKKYLTQNPGW